MGTNKIIVIFCHSRADLLSKSLLSLIKANGIDSWKIIVVRQEGYKSVGVVLNEYREFINTLITVKPNYNFPLGNINYNRVLGTRFAFNVLGAEYVLGIEEDNMISVDSLKFVDFVYKKYVNRRAFRGINLGSIEHGKNVSAGSYSLLRFGLHGSAGVITKRSWNYIEKRGLLNFNFNNPNLAWDARIEFYLKSGFMVTPNLSRNLDLGYGGTFAPISKMDPYFIDINRSWVSSNTRSNLRYEHIQMKHNWRHDSVAYKRANALIFLLRRYELINKVAIFLRLKS